MNERYNCASSTFHCPITEENLHGQQQLVLICQLLQISSSLLFFISQIVKNFRITHQYRCGYKEIPVFENGRPVHFPLRAVNTILLPSAPTSSGLMVS